MDKGIYCLIFNNPGCTIRVGAIGTLTFQAGWHIYIGSAQGRGGLQRLNRHILLAQLRDKKPKWHVDYILTSSCFSLGYAIYAVTEERLECRVAHELNGKCIPGFGCSDCSCISHLFYRHGDPRQEIIAALSDLQLNPIIKTIINAQVQHNI